MALDFWNWDWGRIGSGTASGAATGASIGSFIPGIGTGIGAGIGGLIGLMSGVSAAQENERAEAQRKAAEEQRNSAVGQLSDIARQQQSWLSEDRERRNSLLNMLAGQANPYSMSSPGMQNLLALQQGSIQRNFANARDQVLRSLAQRGALGTAQETSALRRLALDESRALSANEAANYARNYDLAQDFERLRTSQMRGLLGMLGGDTGEGIYSNLANLYQRDAYAAQARGDRADQALSSFLETGISSLPYMRSAPQFPMGTRRTVYSGMGWGA